MLQNSGRPDEADAQHRITVAIAEKVAAEFPDELASGSAQASAAHLLYADFLVKAGRRDAAAAVLRAAKRVWPSDSKVAQAIAKLGDQNRP